ncbi:MAG: pyruvate dehydrogenase complex dihydrolipoamide acetyltransferase [Rhodospirillaceae bacterium]|nr:pyruvate dehydrogenase complex dihydrolipoamide acetyltransferase [Rhodospirillaceae bacterium]
MPIEILMPALSPTMTEGKLARWLKKVGDKIASGDVIAEIETDKATMEMEAVDEGTLGNILVPEGTEMVLVNQPIAVLVLEGESRSVLSTAPAKAPAPKAKPPAPPSISATPVPAAPAPPATPAPNPAAVFRPVASPALAAHGPRIFASPLAKRIAADAGIELAAVLGSGPQGRIVRSDVEHAIGAGGARRPVRARALPATAAGSDYSQPYTEIPNSGIRKTIARRLTEAKSTIPHFYLTVDCIIDDLLKLRKDVNDRAGDNYNLSINDFVIKACALALRKVPEANASWTEEAIRLYNRVDISVAVATPDGLITPIVRDADHKSLGAISNEVKDLAARAKAKKLKLEEFQGGGFSISNLGMYGIKEFSAIINPPQACILAVGKGDQRPVVKNGALAAATVMTCTLSCDHRVVDGAVGAEFMQAFQALIEDPLRMLL